MRSVRTLAILLAVPAFLITCTSKRALNPPTLGLGPDPDPRWAVIDSLSDIGQYATALGRTEAVLTEAREKADWRTEFKAWMYKARFEQYTGTEMPEVLAALEQRAAKADVPLRQVLRSVIASGYWDLYQGQRWQVLERTEMDGDTVPAGDPRTWTQRQFMAKIIAEFAGSLEPIDTLKALSAENLGQLLAGDTGALALRPTVYDVLARRALEIFGNSETRLAEPAWRFKLDSPKHFALFEHFTLDPLVHRDSTAWEFLALRTFQELERSHLSDDTPAALTDVTLDRLAFVRAHSTLAEKDSLYYDALVTLRTRIEQLPAWSEVTVAMANWHVEQAGKYQRLSGDAWRTEKRTARNLCVTAMDKFPGSLGAKNAAALKARLEQPTLQLQAEEAVAPEAPFTISVSYANVPRLWLRLVRDPFDINAQRSWDHDHAAWLVKQRPVRAWDVALPDDGDLNEHVIELPVDGLQPGRYSLIISDTAALVPEQSLFVHAPFWATHLAMAERTQADDLDLLVVDRTTGVPIEGVKASTHVRNYDQSGAQRFVPLSEYTTDKEGLVRTELKGQRGEVLWSLKHGADEFISGSRWVYPYEVGQRPGAEQRTFLFTDRAIYRPGQEIFFKGIVTEKSGAFPEVKAGQSTVVRLFDVNGQLVDSLDLTTDAFGAFHGTFKAPLNVLTGSMRLEEAHGAVAVQVEEYKRPTFEVVLDPVTTTPKLEQDATVTGTARSYAGVPLDGATVKWTVKRGARMPWWCGWGWRGLPWGQQTEIASGEARCDAQGKFTVAFVAQADRAFPRMADPTFFYTVEASAVDISGETQTGSTTLNVGYRSVDIVIGTDEAIDRERTDTLSVRVQNLNGQDVDLPMDVRIVELVPPADAPQRARLWERPDRFLNGSETLLDDPRAWPEKQVRADRKGFRSKDGALKLDGVANWTVGMYRIEVVTRDPEGVEVKADKVFTLYGPSIQNTGFVNEAFHVQPVKVSAEPGEKATVLVSSALPEARVLMEVERDGEIVVNKPLRLMKGQQLIELPVQEGDRGGFFVHFICVERGRQHVVTQGIDVPWSNKDLHVEWTTFRDKLLPGSKEEWRLRITGPKKEKVAAQLLAVMYDASLDHFVPHAWNMDVRPSDHAQRGWMRTEPFGATYGQWSAYPGAEAQDTIRYYPELNTFGFGGTGHGWAYGYTRGAMDGDVRLQSVMVAGNGAPEAVEGRADRMNKEATVEGVLSPAPPPPPADDAAQAAPTGAQPVRSDFRETAFFFPELLTDKDGAVVLRFTTPDALTRWKVLGLAHTTDLKTAQFTKETITQKPLMVVPNLPRFLRHGDRMTFTAKVNVVEGGPITGTATLELFDPFTNAAVAAGSIAPKPAVPFTAAPGSSASVAWTITVPEHIDAVGVRITAQGPGIGDGEQRVLPILTDKVLVTESLPLAMTHAGTKTFALEKLINSGIAGSTLQHRGLKLEFTPNPAWYAVQALPYLMEFPHACAEQIFGRYYANRLAGYIVEERPAIKQVFDQWAAKGGKNDAGAFLSALDKNPELKAVLLEETPWVMNAKDERERQQRIALFFDMQRMAAEEAASLKKLQEMQLGSGAWPWWSGMGESRYITQHIVAGLGHLEKLNAADLRSDGPSQRMLERAVRWLDAEVDRTHQERMRRSTKQDYLTKHVPDAMEIHYLYARSLFPRWSFDGGTRTAVDFLKERLAATWLQNGVQLQAMSALALDRLDDKVTPALILRSLSERATRSEELGMYWKDFNSGMLWQEFPTETHALMIEAYHEVGKDAESVNALRQYLLKLKQTTDWKTTKATADACYALLLTGPDWLEPKDAPVIKVGGVTMKPEQAEAGTGYFEHTWTGSEVKPAMGEVTVTTTTDGVQWGALHWQYLEQMDKVTTHNSPLRIAKQVMLHEQTDAGARLIALTEARTLKPGDKLTVRIELRTDRYVDYVHLKDLRAAGLEPVDAISGYQWKAGLGYYQSIRDAGMHFFFDRIAPGTYVFEYDLRVTHAGDFSNGITTAQCMYAPEFSSHSAGERIHIGE